MNTVMGIVLLVVFVIGLASVLRYFAKLSARFLGRNGTTQSASIAQAKFVRVGHGNVLTNLNDLPQYKGETGIFGLPRYRDVIVPNKHNYATVVYMDHPVKQWVYDCMASWKAGFHDKENPSALFWTLCFLAVPFLFSKALGIAIVVVAVLLFIFSAPSGNRAVRRMAENAKNFTPDDWRKIYKEVAESQEREDEMVRAIRRSGVRRL